MNFKGLGQIIPGDSALLVYRGSCYLHSPGHTACLGLGSLPCGIQATVLFIAHAGLSDSFIITLNLNSKLLTVLTAQCVFFEQTDEFLRRLIHTCGNPLI